MNAVIYARYSSSNQKETSIDDQLRVCQEYADNNDINIIGKYLDYEQTGTSDNREQFQRMLRDSSRCIFDAILVYEFTRFARNRYDSVIYKHRLKSYNIHVVSVTEYIPNSPEGILMESLLEGMAEYYSQNLKKNVMRGLVGIALQCKHTGGRPLLGYRVLKDKTYDIDEITAPAVRLIFDRYSTGYTYTEIMKELNAKGYKTGAGKSFGKNSLYSLLTNERYIGIYTYNRRESAVNGKRSNTSKKNDDDIVRIEGGLPAIIDSDTWAKVQARMEENKRAPARSKATVNYLLSGKIFCGECKGSMVGHRTVGYSGDYYYYACATKQRLKTCHKSHVRKERIEKQVLDYIKTTLQDKYIEKIAIKAVELQQNNSAQDCEIKRLQTAITNNDKSLKNIMEAIEQGIFTSSTKERIAEIEEEQSNLEQALNLAVMSQHMIYSKEAITTWLKSFQTATDRELVDNLLHSVYVFDDYIDIYTNYGSNSQKDKHCVLDSADLPAPHIDSKTFKSLV